MNSLPLAIKPILHFAALLKPRATNATICYYSMEVGQKDISIEGLQVCRKFTR